MGTNYYWHKEPCPTCNHSENKYHVGKSSGGWAFTFQALQQYESPIERPIMCADDWREVLARPDGKLFDEYGKQMAPEDFWHLVELKKDGKQHAVETKEAYWGSTDRTWLDKDGHSFCTGYFS